MAAMYLDSSAKFWWRAKRRKERRAWSEIRSILRTSFRQNGGFLPGCGPACWWAWSKQAPYASMWRPSFVVIPGHFWYDGRGPALRFHEKYLFYCLGLVVCFSQIRSRFHSYNSLFVEKITYGKGWFADEELAYRFTFILPGFEVICPRETRFFLRWFRWRCSIQVWDFNRKLFPWILYYLRILPILLEDYPLRSQRMLFHFLERVVASSRREKIRPATPTAKTSNDRPTEVTP